MAGSGKRGGLDRANPRSLTYKQAGVDIDAKMGAIARAKDAILRSATPGVLGSVGLFGGLFDPARVGCDGWVLVASADGVGTKLEVAKRARRYDTVGRDIVHHCIDDILVQGARPLFFMDYVATGRLDPEVVSALIEGCADACRENGLALLGGETAEMPGMYADGDFDLAGFIVGAVRRDRILDGTRVAAGQMLLGLRSSGLHTNGYSLARRIAFDHLGLTLEDRPKELGGETLGEALLAPHRSYLGCLLPLVEGGRIAALAHITGGGFVDNIPRVLSERFDAVIDREAWELPGLFRFLVDGGNVAWDEAWRVFNMGVGMICFVDPDQCSSVEEELVACGEAPIRLGRVEEGGGVVRWADGSMS